MHSRMHQRFDERAPAFEATTPTSAGAAPARGASSGAAVAVAAGCAAATSARRSSPCSVDEPGHGYDIMSRLEEKSGGVWRPSAGSVYPTLQQLEDEGLVTSADADGKRVFTITDDGPHRGGPPGGRRRRRAVGVRRSEACTRAGCSARSAG